MDAMKVIDNVDGGSKYLAVYHIYTTDFNACLAESNDAINWTRPCVLDAGRSCMPDITRLNDE